MYNKQDNSVAMLSTVDGFAEGEVTALGYAQNRNLLIIGYKNGNIDVYNDQEEVIYNLDGLQQASIPGSKKINHIHIRQNRAYVSGDFGVVVINLVAVDIVESYINIGAGGSQVEVYASALDANADSLFLATSAGVMVGRVSPVVNLAAPENWHTFSAADSIPTDDLAGVVLFSGEVYAVVSEDSIYRFNGEYWEDSPVFLNGAEVRSVTASPSGILIALENTVLRVTDFTTSVVISDPAWNDPQQAVLENSGTVWVADGTNGLFSNLSGAFSSFTPNGPASNRQFSLHNDANKVLVAHGGYTTTGAAMGRDEGFSVFNNVKWKGYNQHRIAGYPDFPDIVAAAREPSTGRLFLGSFEKGILILNTDGSYDSVTVATSGTPFASSARVSDLVFDDSGNLWVANYGVTAGTPSLHRRDGNGNWQSYNISVGSATSHRPVEIVIDDFGNKWIRVWPAASGGIVVFNEQSGNIRHLSTTSGQGGLQQKNVNSIAKDRSGAIWAGTNDGIAVFFSPATIFSGSVNASRPVFNGRSLFTGEVITKVKVDGGNRKWIGTNKGVWLLEDDGTEDILFFSKVVSPVFSDKIIDITINHQSGEVFIATEEGLISFRSDATKATEQHENVKIFPNPVHAGFAGTIGISGLAMDAQVKITDITGNLVYETDANGGTASWNGRRHDGQHAAAGIYLVFSSSLDGEDAFVGKIAVIR